MLFMYIHTHSVEKCIADKPQETARIMSSVQEEAQKAGIKLQGIYIAAHEHTIYCILEADDVLKLERALHPMTLWGNARLIPIAAAQQLAAAMR